MIRFVLRFIGFWAFAGGFVLTVLDGIRSLAASDLVFTPLGQTWYTLHSASLNASQAAIQRYVHPAVWDPVVQTILQAPTGLTLLLLGALLWALGERRGKSRVGYAV